MLRARQLMAQAAEPDPPHGAQAAEPAPAAPEYELAIAALRDVQAALGSDSEMARAAMYLIGKCYERLPGESDAALEQFARVRKLHPGTPEGVAASLAEADLLRRVGHLEQAQAAYQRTLQAAGDPSEYHNRWLPQADLRKTSQDGLDALVDAGQFSAALALLEAFSPTFDHITTLTHRASVYAAWGEHWQAHAAQQPGTEKDAAMRSARAMFRRAAKVYEQVAAARMAEREYPNDLWRAIENHLRGRSFSSAASLLQTYLAREAVARRPMALVKLGEAHLAMGDLGRAILALEECIELHEEDASVYTARLLAARAYAEKHEPEKAAELLRANLTARGVTPQSQEWRESLLALGKLHYAAGKYEPAIQSLGEYVQRYDGEEPDTLLAHYLVAQSHRLAASEPLRRLAAAITENERLKHRSQAEKFLSEALDHFAQVQRTLTLKSAGGALDPLEQAILRNCYYFRGDVYFAQREYEQALEVFRNASSLPK
jgi:tetratricopeptide (TPR) repeat protein